MIVAGEASGDNLGASVAREIRRRLPAARLFGIGGPRMREAGVETLVDAAEMAVVGLVEVISHFPVIHRAWKGVTGIIDRDPPDLLIPIDYPDFNLRVAQRARRRGVPVLYFVSPQIWAWRPGRVHGIAQRVDHMAVVFPFEVPLYQRASVPVTFVGHPLLDTVPPPAGRGERCRELGLDPSRPVVGLFPGSRRSEIRMLLSTIGESARLLRERHPQVQFVLPLASTLSPDDLRPLDLLSLPLTVVRERAVEVMDACDAILTVSGTVTLEIALKGVPMVIIYRVSPLTYQIGKRVIRVDHIGLCNIVAGERIVPELIQDEAEPVRICGELERFLDDPDHAASVRRKLSLVRDRLGEPGAAGRVADIALSLIERRKG